MSILDYFKKTTLPNPNGSLSHSVPALAITNANKEVAKEVEKATCSKKSTGFRKYNVFTTKQ